MQSKKPEIISYPGNQRQNYKKYFSGNDDGSCQQKRLIYISAE